MKQIIPIEFTISATIRPELHRKSYESFRKHLKYVDWDNSVAYLNIDPVPVESIEMIEDCISIAEEYFGTVISFIPKSPHFTVAMKHLWSLPNGEYFFNLEDDWILTEDVSIVKLVSMLKESSIYSMINLRAYPQITDNRICLSPGLLLTSFGNTAAKLWDINYNPETQIRNGYNCEIPELLKHKSMHWPGHQIITDIGRDWIKNTEYYRTDGKTFLTWNKR